MVNKKNAGRPKKSDMEENKKSVGDLMPPEEKRNGEEKEEKEIKKEHVSHVLKRQCGCCNKELEPLPAGQKYFEAPDGHVIIGEDKIMQVWDRRGKGSWINPVR